ncbi:hypothetical protein KSP40_PGU013740 [Platanthera guangdongensis]|uniref:Uncharacterized protein n=1 Tax=Platanthera guangdongensis TaxID=2320717 RepID=A0ABR2MSD7_9ASPA
MVEVGEELSKNAWERADGFRERRERTIGGRGKSVVLESWHLQGGWEISTGKTEFIIPLKKQLRRPNKHQNAGEALSGQESKNHKGYAFAEYETEEVANYAIRLFSGLVRLHNKNLRFACEERKPRLIPRKATMSGQDKLSHNSASPAAKKMNSSPMPNPRHAGEMCAGNYSEESSHSTIIRKDAVDGQMTDPARPHYTQMQEAVLGSSYGRFLAEIRRR